MKQTEISNKPKQQNMTVTMPLIALFVSLLCMIVLSQESWYLNMNPHKLILTQQGCSNISSLGLVPKRETSGCSIIARYRSRFLGSDGAILLDDDRFVTLSSAAVLANADTGEVLPDTPMQQRARLIQRVIYAVVFTMVILIGYALFRAKKQQQKGKKS